MEKITFDTEDGEKEFYVLAETKLQGKSYILISETPADEDNGDFSVLCDISGEEDEYSEYCEIEDEDELIAVIKVFNEMLDDVDLEV
ncbi:Protein of unknown function [Eubacterium ruminantium]|nr:Protein of unknown function [Eubacterium ruminantium]